MTLAFWLGRRTARASRRAPRRTTTRLSIEVLEDRAVPAFLAPVEYPGVGPTLVADFNNDGIQDTVANLKIKSGPYVVDTHVITRLGNGDGTFGEPLILNLDPPYDVVDKMVSGDFNNDAKLDLVLILPGDYATVLLGNGDGTFQPPASRFLSGGYGSGGHIAVGDVTNDGNLDFVVLSYTGDFSPDAFATIRAFLGDGNGGFLAAPRKIIEVNEFFDATLADFNGDGKLDLLTTSRVNGRPNPYNPSWPPRVPEVALWLGNGDGTFQAPAGVGMTLPGGRVSVGDFNADGNMDVARMLHRNESLDLLSVYATRDAQNVAVALGNGDGTFQAPAIYAIPPNAVSFTTADFNGDGSLDLMTGHTNGGGISILLGQGDGTFAVPLVLLEGSSAAFLEGALVYRPQAADLTGDDLPDLVFGNSSTYSVAVNDGAWDDFRRPVEVSISDVTVTEGHTGTTAAVFTVTLAAPSDQTMIVKYATVDGTALARGPSIGPNYSPPDYVSAYGTLTFAPGETSKTITVLVNGDRVAEGIVPTETFFVNLFGVTHLISGDVQGVVTILDDEPRVSISDVTKAEGKKGQNTLFTFTVTLSVAYDQPVTISYRTTDGTATTSDKDYVAASGTLTFAPGETTKTITIKVKGDSKREADETFYLDLFGLKLDSNALFTKKRGIGTILNDD